MRIKLLKIRNKKLKDESKLIGYNGDIITRLDRYK